MLALHFIASVDHSSFFNELLHTYMYVVISHYISFDSTMFYMYNIIQALNYAAIHYYIVYSRHRIWKLHGQLQLSNVSTFFLWMPTDGMEFGVGLCIFLLNPFSLLSYCVSSCWLSTGWCQVQSRKCCEEAWRQDALQRVFLYSASPTHLPLPPTHPTLPHPTPSFIFSLLSLREEPHLSISLLFWFCHNQGGKDWKVFARYFQNEKFYYYSDHFAIAID